MIETLNLMREAAYCPIAGVHQKRSLVL